MELVVKWICCKINLIVQVHYVVFTTGRQYTSSLNAGIAINPCTQKKLLTVFAVAHVVVGVQLHVGGATWRSWATAWFSGYVDGCPGRTSCRTPSMSETPKSGGRSTPAFITELGQSFHESVRLSAASSQEKVWNLENSELYKTFLQFYFSSRVRYNKQRIFRLVWKLMLLVSLLQKSRKHLWIYDQVFRPSR